MYMYAECTLSHFIQFADTTITYMYSQGTFTFNLEYLFDIMGRRKIDIRYLVVYNNGVTRHVL